MRTHHYFYLGITIAMIVTAVVGAAVFVRPYKYQGTLIEPPVQVGEINLTDQYGQPFQLSQLLETEDVRAVAIFFGYVHCPDVCPITLAEFKRAKEKLGPQAEYVRFVFITVDPERDSPEFMQRHLANYDPDFIGLTGSPEELEAVWEKFWVYREVQESSSAGGYLVDHSTRVYVLDADGQLGLTFGFASGSDLMAADLAQMVKSGRW